jgi:peroxiredoxin
MKRWHWAAVALAFVLLAAGAILLRWQEDAGAERAGAAEDDLFLRNKIERPHNPVQAEPFQAIALNGGRPGLADYAGRYILLNFWATWCEPCKVEMPELQALYDGLKERNVVVLAVSMQESAEKVSKFLETVNYTFPVYADPEGKVAELYGVGSIPLTYLIRPDGRIEGRALGPRDWNDPALRDYLAAQAAAGR